MNETDLFIELTSASNDRQMTFYTKHIAVVYPNDDQTTVIGLSSGENLAVKESYPVVLSMLPNISQITEIK